MTDSITSKKLPWQVKLFFLTFLLPVEASFPIGDFRLTPNRVLLILAFVPCLRIVFSNSVKRLPTDWLLLLYSFWLIFSLLVNHDLAQGLKSGGILVLESLGAYLFARAFIRDEEDFYNFLKIFVFIVIVLSLFTIPETLTGMNIFRPQIGHIDTRLGLQRSFGPFDHPILYGCFCASIVSLSWFYRVEKRLLRTVWLIIATFMSVSSGPLVAVAVQLILLVWKTITRSLNSRWKLFSFLLAIVYVIIDLISNRTPLKVFLSYLTFSPATAYFRTIIWDWGIQENVKKNPWFGIGFEEWIRPSWMHATSIDNFWLVNMVRYGLPTFIFLALGILAMLFAIGKVSADSESGTNIRTGFVFSFIGLIIAGCTVHFWNSSYVWLFFFLGSGACLTQLPVNSNNG
ncbi:MAG: O-antigen ligase family protein [Chlorobium sp.]|nr:O-antigen ligase family protein [Chlorobium sp.]